MQSSEVRGLHCLVPSNLSPFPTHFDMLQDNSSTLYCSRFSNSLYEIPHQFQDFNQLSSGISSNSTSDEADELQVSLINERKQRRMISNRESARRSRMRKQRHLDELWSQVLWLRNENRDLMHKLNHVSETHDKILEENVQLKEEASEMRQKLNDMQIHSPYPTLNDLENRPCNIAYPRAESSSQSNASSLDLRH